MEIITAEQALEEAKGLTFEKVWAALMETRMRMEESRQEAERSRQESEKSMKKYQRRMDKMLKELSNNVGGVNNKLGLLTEASFSGELWKKFDDFGYNFTKQAPHVKFIIDNKVAAEADFFLEDGKYVMPVEVKTEPSEKDVDRHLKRIEIIRQYMDAREDKRKIVGAIAGGIIAKNVMEYAQEKGLYVFVQTNDSIAVADSPANFKAREW